MRKLGLMVVVAASLAGPGLGRADCASDCSSGCETDDAKAWASCTERCIKKCLKDDPPAVPDVPKPTPVDPLKEGKKT